MSIRLLSWHLSLSVPFILWDRKVKRSQSTAGTPPNGPRDGLGNVDGDDCVEKLTILEMTDDLIALAQRDPETGEVGTLWLSRSQARVVAELMGHHVLN